MDVVRELVKHKYPLDQTKDNGVTAAGIAAHSGDIMILKALVEGGADINKLTN